MFFRPFLYRLTFKQSQSREEARVARVTMGNAFFLGIETAADFLKQEANSKMAAFVATHDKSVLPKTYDEMQVSNTQRLTHDDILGKFLLKVQYQGLLFYQ